MTAKTRRVFCDTHMGQVHCVTGGQGEATPLLLLHQTPRSTDEFAEVLPILARERRVIAMDTPGYGCSDRVPGAQPSVEDYARAAFDVLDALGHRKAIVVGHHTGEIIGCEMAAAAPDRIDGVVCSGPIDLDEKGREYLKPFFKQWTIAADGSHLSEKFQKFLPWLPTQDLPLVQRLVVDLFRAGTESEQGHFATTFYRMEDRLPLVRCPALFIYGARDPFAKSGSAPLHSAAFRPVTEVTIDAGVFSPAENPQAFAGAILEWLKTV
jgi:pimeloyl-ACP methyl ester carboxylesterase